MLDSLAVSKHTDRLVDAAFKIDPTSIYGWALAALVIVVLSLVSTIVLLFKFHNKKLAEAQAKNDQNTRDLMAAKLEAVGAMRDILHALNIISVGQKDSTKDVLEHIDNLKEAVTNKIEQMK